MTVFFYRKGFYFEVEHADTYKYTEDCIIASTKYILKEPDNPVENKRIYKR